MSLCSLNLQALRNSKWQASVYRPIALWAGAISANYCKHLCGSGYFDYVMVTPVMVTTRTCLLSAINLPHCTNGIHMCCIVLSTCYALSDDAASTTLLCMCIAVCIRGATTAEQQWPLVACNDDDTSLQWLLCSNYISTIWLVTAV
jgi:hypothetical protein